MKRLIAVTMCFLLLAGCNSSNVGDTNGESGDLKNVKLKMYLIGDGAPDYDMVLDEINTLMKNDINATLETSWLVWADWNQRYPLILSSGEQFDMIFSGDWAMYGNQAQKGAFLELNELLPKYAPQSYAEMPPEVWEQVEYNDKLYMLPMNYKEITPQGFVVRGDLRKKYGVGEIKTLDDFGAYLEGASKDPSGIIPYNAGAFDLEMWLNYITLTGDCDVFSYALALPHANPTEVNYLVDTPEYLKLLETTRSWFQAGYWSREVLVNKTAARDSLVNGTSAACILGLLNFNELYLKVDAKNPEWELEWYEIAPGSPKRINDYSANGVSISANSKNPERSLMMLELFRNNEEYFDLTTYGIRGKHYELNDQGKLTLPEGVTADTNGFPPDNACPWGWRQDKFYKSYANAWPKYDETLARISETAYFNTVRPFKNMDDSLYKNEQAAIINVRQQYELPMMWGVVDYNTGLPELRQKLEDAGISKVKTLVEERLTAYFSQ